MSAGFYWILVTAVFVNLPYASLESNHSGTVSDSYGLLTEERPNRDVDDQCYSQFFYNSSIEQCKCVKCTEQGVLLKFGHCMTNDVTFNQPFVSSCKYFQLRGHIKTHSRSIRLPNNISKLNDYMCGPMNRTGRLCSECIEGFGPSYTSMGYQCSNCTETWYSIPRLLLVEIGPLTIFYFFVLFFRIQMTSAPMTCFILYCHCVMYIITSSMGDVANFRNDGETSSVMFTIGITLFGVWNLDLLRYLIPPFCISDQLKEVHIHLLEYFFPCIQSS